VNVLQLAARLALIDSHSEEFSFAEVIDNRLCKRLALSVDDLNQAAEFAAIEASNILAMMNPKLFSK